jgi:hypothetical protein
MGKTDGKEKYPISVVAALQLQHWQKFKTFFTQSMKKRGGGGVVIERIVQ